MFSGQKRTCWQLEVCGLTAGTYPVTAEAAGSSPVVPAILLNGLQGSGHGAFPPFHNPFHKPIPQRHSFADLADAIRLLMLTGSRHSEVLTAKWADFDLERGRWTKPSHATKQRRIEHVPLNQAALSVLFSMPRTGQYLLAGKNGHRESLRKPWHDVLKAARLPKTLGLHDLRHSFASTLVSDGASLYAVGKLLGHTRHQTTQRYAHLAPQALQETTERLGKAYRSILQ